MAVLSIWLGWLIAGRALRPLRTITNAAREISASNLHRRLALDGPDDELKQLGDDVRRAPRPARGLLRGAAAVRRERLARAAHAAHARARLSRSRSPTRTRASTSLRETCEQVLAVGEQQERLIEALLTLSRSQRGLDRPRAGRPGRDHGRAVDAVDRRRPASSTRRSSRRETSGDPRLRRAARRQPHRQRRPLQRPARPRRRRHREPTAAAPCSRSTNTGPTSRPSELDRLFQPFQRLDGDRTGEPTGSGLGLSIVDAHRRGPLRDAHDTRPARGRPRRSRSPSPRPERGQSVHQSAHGDAVAAFRPVGADRDELEAVGAAFERADGARRDAHGIPRAERRRSRRRA